MRLSSTVFVMGVLLSGCMRFAYFNDEQATPAPVQPKASFELTAPRGQERTLVILALSGGGSRAAYWSGAVMLKLAEVFKADGIDLLKEVDAISSVSGGSLPAAYYAISGDPDQGSPKPVSGRVWDEATVKDLMSRDYRTRWIANWFWPTNFLRFWFTAYDRTDILAQVFADNLYDREGLGSDLTMADLNPERPYLIINATNGTVPPIKASDSQHCLDSDGGSVPFGCVFTFTAEDFARLRSDLNRYDVGRAVMASATFPGVFNYMTLRDFAASRYLHVFDGGNADNLGLKSAERLIKKNADKYDGIVVILIDAYTDGGRVTASDYDGRGLFGYLLDLNFLDSFESLLGNLRYAHVDRTRNVLLEALNADTRRTRTDDDKAVLLYHLKFDNVCGRRDQYPSPCNVDPTFQKLNSVSTDFRISDADLITIDAAVSRLIVKDNQCLTLIKDIIRSRGRTDRPRKITSYPYCTWNQGEDLERKEPF